MNSSMPEEEDGENDVHRESLLERKFEKKNQRIKEKIKLMNDEIRR